MSKIRFKEIIWMPFPMSCEFCRASTSMAIFRPLALKMRCRDHLLPSVHGNDIPKLERWLQAIDQTSLTIRTGAPLSSQDLRHQIGELRGAYTWHWLRNAGRETDAASYREGPEMRERFDEQTHLSITNPLPVQGDVPDGTLITLDAPPSLVHYWTRQDVIKEMLQSGWGIEDAQSTESRQPGEVHNQT